MKKLLTFVVGAAAVAGAAYWAAKYLTGCEKPQSVYPQPVPDPAEQPEAEEMCIRDRSWTRRCRTTIISSGRPHRAKPAAGEDTSSPAASFCL